MIRIIKSLSLIAASLALLATPAQAQTPRELLVSAAYGTRDKAVALARVETALRNADATLARSPNDREAQLQRALAIGYRGKLKRNRGDLLVARKGFEALIASRPADAEPLMALAGWDLGAIIELGPMMARAGLGARKSRGIEALDRAVALAAGRPLFPAFASITRIQVDPADVKEARRLAELALAGAATTALDRIMQRHAAALLPLLREIGRAHV